MVLAAVVVGAAAVALAAAPALAFRPSVQWVLGKVEEKSKARATTSLKVDAATTTWDLAGRPVIEGVAERVWLQAPGKLRRELDVDGGAIVEVRADGKLVTRAPGKPDSSQKQGLDVLADMMTIQGDADMSGKLLASIKALGVNPEVVSFARFDGRVAYLIGSKPWEADKPQLWLDKDLLVPLRLVTFIKDGGQAVRIDLRYLGWGSPVGGAWYPQTVEIWRNDALVRRTVTENLERNTELSAGLFDPR